MRVLLLLALLGAASALQAHEQEPMPAGGWQKPQHKVVTQTVTHRKSGPRGRWVGRVQGADELRIVEQASRWVRVRRF